MKSLNPYKSQNGLWKLGKTTKTVGKEPGISASGEQCSPEVAPGEVHEKSIVLLGRGARGSGSI